MQKAVLFSGTIRDNLKFGNLNASEEEMEEALSISQSKEFVDQKEGKLDAIIAQGGKNLSGGQKILELNLLKKIFQNLYLQ